MKKQDWTIMLSAFTLVILILDTKTAILGMTDGITLCLQTLIPSLFPFIVLSMLLTSSLLGRMIPLLGPLGRLLGMPAGTESIFLVGLLGGYPVGAQSIAQAVRSGHISRENGQRMLAFCSNAGPAFLFGLGTRLFPSAWHCWMIWGIHIISAIIVGVLAPGVQSGSGCVASGKPVSIPAALRASIQTMAQICGWVVLFRVILAFCQRWFLWMLPYWVQLLFSGILELANGCCTLAQVPQPEVRMALFSLFLGFGGLCVLMQTRSVCAELRISRYLWGKILQAVISFLITISIISREMRFVSTAVLMALCGTYYFISRKSQKGVAFFQKPVYNKENFERGTYHDFSQENRAPLRLLRTRHYAE